MEMEVRVDVIKLEVGFWASLLMAGLELWGVVGGGKRLGEEVLDYRGFGDERLVSQDLIS